METRARLEQAVVLLNQLDERRHTSGDPGVGSAIERSVIDRELKALEEDILADPGALIANLVPVRMRRHGEARKFPPL